MGTADSVASTTTSTTNNAALAAADEVNCNSSTGKNPLSTLNFSILNKNVMMMDDDVDNDVANNIVYWEELETGYHSWGMLGVRDFFSENAWSI
ncbi:UNVERIFIED_CONTAM: hypothetical protein Sindi_2427500 [Sesamum indicum]